MKGRKLVRATVVTISAVVMFVAMTGHAAVKPAGIFGSNMVLQRGMAVPVWGWGDAGEEVSVSFAGQTKTAATGPNGKWMVKLDALKASAEARDLKINGITYTNVLVGEVWLCSGQSNMQWGLGGALNGKDEIAAAKYPHIRLVTTPTATAPAPQKDVSVSWVECSPATVGRFSAVGYFFGKRLHKELGIPIGLINSSWGGTKVEPWTAPEGFRLVPELKAIADRIDAATPKSEAGKKAHREVIEKVKAWIPQAEAALAAEEQPPSLPSLPSVGRGRGDPTMIYNAKIHPLVPYAIRGAIWYQGESNGGEGESYFHKKTALINGWRKIWGQDMSFYFVQLADFRAPNKNPAGGDGWAKLREAQRKTLTIPDTGMAVITDIGNARNIHPNNKQDVGYRLSLWALAKDYHRKDLVYSGPLYKGHKVDGGKIRLSFDHVGGGLMTGVRKKGLEPTVEDETGILKHFAIAGADKKWVWANAAIDGETVVVSSEAVPEPVAVRYAFATNPEGANLYNKEGLPASPFRTDKW